MRKFLYVCFSVLLIIIIVEIGYYFSLTNKKPVPENHFDIRVQKPDDTDGRSVIYDYKKADVLGFNDVGVVSNPPDTYVIGTFEKLEPIPDSKDRYLILTNPDKKTALPKVRIVYEPSPLLSSVFTTTALGVEYVENPGMVDPNNYITMDKVSDEKLADLILNGDILVTVLDRSGKKDQNGARAAWWLALRRYQNNPVKFE